ncbi:hypothetical protein VBD025_02870 [Virgibacillus flavescens]|uniref:hypothetical protein n=1 Tax=Virgibacillus flavescens TaxID=1611422 RepID=UPI003D32C59F
MKKSNRESVSYTMWKEWENYENYIYFDEIINTDSYDAYADTPSKKDCDQICGEKSGEVIIYKINAPDISKKIDIL